jgi:hypothetical protein
MSTHFNCIPQFRLLTLIFSAMYNTSQCTFFDAIFDQSRAAIFQFTIGKIAQVPALEATRINLLAQILPSIVCQVKSRSGFEIL